MAKVTSSNTKAQILEKYEEQVKILQEQKLENAALRQELEQKQELLQKAAETVHTGAAINIQQIRQTLSEQLEKLELALAGEQKKFEELQKAVEIEEDQLKDLYQIKAQAESLEALTITHRQVKKNMEEEMKESKENLDIMIQEAKKEWKREEEEYQYNLALKRRNEQDNYNDIKKSRENEMAERKSEFEKSIALREKAIAEQEDELLRLRKEVEGFEGRTQKTLASAEKELTERLTTEFEYKQKLQVKDLEADLKLREQMIHSLESKIKEQQEYITSMSAKTDNASQQVKDIALKAIEKSGIVSVPAERRRERDEKSGD